MSTVASRKRKKSQHAKKKADRKAVGKKTGQAAKRLLELGIDRKMSEEHFAAWARSRTTGKQPAPLSKLLGSPQCAALLWGVSRGRFLAVGSRTMALRSRRNSADSPTATASEGHRTGFETGSRKTPVSDDSRALVDQLWRIERHKDACDDATLATGLSEWREGAEAREPDLGFALECLAWAHLLPRLADALSARRWWELLEQLIAIASEAGSHSDSETPWQPQLFSVELPLTLAYLFPEIKDCQRLVTSAVNVLSQGLDDLLDGEGMIHADNLKWQRVLCASWIRSLLLIKQLPGKKQRISKDARLQFEWLVRNLLRLTRADGSPALGQADGSKEERSAYREMMKVALSITKDQEDRALAKAVFRSGKRWPLDLPDDMDLPPEPACHSEWAQWAVLQPDWSPLSPRLTVTFAHRTMRAELSSMNRTLVSGSIDPEVRIDGRLLEGQSDWEVVCWESDDDVDFIELEMEYEGQWKIQRQIIMAREDMFLLLSDAILGRDSHRIDYLQKLPLADGVKFLGAKESHEGSLKSGKRLALILPIGLPEWRSDSRLGTFKREHGVPVLRQHQEGTALNVPLFVDLHPERQRKRLTWRPLTVAEQLEIVRPDVAAAYRIQVASEQWLYYRSLTPAANRTFLGQNYSSESVVGRFLEDGTTEELVEIEGSP